MINRTGVKTMELKVMNAMNRGAEKVNTFSRRVMNRALKKEPGIDGILVTVGLCIIALLLCVVMKDSLKTFIETLVTALQTKATGILNGV